MIYLGLFYPREYGRIYTYMLVVAWGSKGLLEYGNIHTFNSKRLIAIILEFYSDLVVPGYKVYLIGIT